ncbi:GyrI-like domain-containing protein [Candidatus Neomarinimicrobiota bacterium]
MDKIDFKKDLKHLYKPSSKKVEAVHVPEMNFCMLDGQGDPNTSSSYAQAIEALYSTAYTLKFMIKQGELAIDFGVLPLEGLWWADDMSDFLTGNKSRWKWTMMIMQPDFITPTLFENAVHQVKQKKNLPAIDKIRFAAFAEGNVAQILHIGPFDAEKPNIDKVHQFIEDANMKRIGKHHEIYLSDIRRAAPEKWKTIIRQPMG